MSNNEKCDVDPFILYHQNAALVNQYKAMKTEVMKVKDLEESLKKDNLNKEEFIGLCLNKIHSLYDYLLHFLTYLESLNNVSVDSKNSLFMDSEFYTNKKLFKDISQYCSPDGEMTFKVDSSSIADFYTASFKDLDLLLHRYEQFKYLVGTKTASNEIPDFSQVYREMKDLYIQELNQYKSLYPLFISKLKSLKEQNNKLEASLKIKEKLLSKELSYEIIRKQLDVQQTIEQQYKDHKRILEDPQLQDTLLNTLKPNEQMESPIPILPVKNEPSPIEKSSDIDIEEYQKMVMISKEREVLINQMEEKIEKFIEVQKQLEKDLAIKTEECNQLSIQLLKEQRMNEVEMNRAPNYKLQEENDVLKMQLMNLHQSLNQSVQEMNEKYDNQIKKLIEENTNLVKENTSLRAKSDVYKQKCWNRSTLYKQVQEQSDLIVQLQDSISHFQMIQSNEGNTIVSMLSDEISKLTAAYESSNNNLKIYKKQIETMDKMNEKNAIDISKHIESILLLKHNISQLQKEKESLLIENQEFQSKIHEQEQNRNQIYQNYMNIYNEFDHYQKKVEVKIQLYEEFEQKLNEYHHEIEQLKQYIEEKYKKIYDIIGTQKKLRIDLEKSIQEVRKQNPEQDESIVDLLYNEIQSFKKNLTCEVCNENPKDSILTSCYHILCKHCIDERINRRERKCPLCLIPFGKENVQKIKIFNDNEILHNWDKNHSEFSSYPSKRTRK